MKDYSNYTRADFQAMSNKEFEEFVEHEYEIYLSQIKHEDDYIPYSEFFTELSVMMGRQDSVRRFN
jgi:hypothetical protein